METWFVSYFFVSQALFSRVFEASELYSRGVLYEYPLAILP